MIALLKLKLLQIFVWHCLFYSPIGNLKDKVDAYRLIQGESNWQIDAISSKNCCGLFQLSHHWLDCENAKYNLFLASYKAIEAVVYCKKHCGKKCWKRCYKEGWNGLKRCQHKKFKKKHYNRDRRRLRF